MRTKTNEGKELRQNKEGKERNKARKEWGQQMITELRQHKGRKERNKARKEWRQRIRKERIETK